MITATTYSEHELLRRLALNDESSFEQLYRRFHSSLFHFVKRKVADPELAGDITSTCFIKFWKGGKRDFDSLEGVHAYLLRSASNAIINAHRDQQAYENRQEELIRHLSIEVDAAAEREDEYRAALMQHVLAEIDKLPKKCKLVFIKAYFEEMRNEEIAKELKLSYLTVRNQKNKALKLLRIALLAKKLIPVLLFIDNLRVIYDSLRNQ